MITAQFIAWLASQSATDLEVGISSLGKCDLAIVLRNELSRRRRNAARN